MSSDFLRISPKIACLPIIHGSGDYAIEVRRRMLATDFDCLAVPLPPSFQADVERAVHLLPSISAVLQDESRFVRDDEPAANDAFADEDADAEGPAAEAGPSCSYVPIDPCQGVIAGLRFALQEQIPRAFVDRETATFEPQTAVLPDPYALKRVSVERFAAAVLPAIAPPRRVQHRQRCLTMAARLRELERRHSSILFLCSLMDWPWIRDAYRDGRPLDDEDFVEPTRIVSVQAATLAFFLGELPFVTAEYERARANLDDDENLSIDGVKSLVLAARDRYARDLKSLARDHPQAPLGLFPVRPQPGPRRAADDARFVFAGARGPASLRRPVCPARRGDGPRVSRRRSGSLRPHPDGHQSSRGCPTAKS